MRPGCRTHCPASARTRSDGLVCPLRRECSSCVRLGVCRGLRCRPLLTAGRAVRVDDRAIAAVLILRPHDGGQVAEDACPDATLGPAVIAILNRGGRAVFRRAVLPATPRLPHRNDAADDPPVVFARGPCLFLRKMLLKNRPVQVVQPEPFVRFCFLHGHATPPSLAQPLTHQRRANSIIEFGP